MGRTYLFATALALEAIFLSELSPTREQRFPSLDALKTALPACRSATDHCMTCATDGGEPVCSVIGFACQKRDWACTSIQ